MILRRPMRHYPFGALASHTLGYVGEPLEMAELPGLRAFDFYDQR